MDIIPAREERSPYHTLVSDMSNCFLSACINALYEQRQDVCGYHCHIWKSDYVYKSYIAQADIALARTSHPRFSSSVLYLIYRFPRS